MPLYHQAIAQPKKMLANLLGWLDKAKAHAEDKSFKEDVLVSARLAPNQFSLDRQVQSACDTAKFIASRVGDVEAPKNDDTEKTVDELRERIKSTIAFLDTVDAAVIDGADDKRIKLAFLGDKSARAEDYVVEFALPNMYFHITTAYAILRHNGVDLGKRDFIGSIRLED